VLAHPTAAHSWTIKFDHLRHVCFCGRYSG
jgi:hypothetical protein